jgi:hypothetical protein
MTKPIEAEKIPQNPFQLQIVSKIKNIPFYKTNLATPSKSPVAIPMNALSHP